MTDRIEQEGQPAQPFAGGKRFELSGNDPRLLRRTGSIWLVETGRVEVYAAEQDRSRGAGVRRFLFEIGAGQLLPGMAAEAEEAGLVLHAVGLDAGLVEIERTHFDESIRRPDLVDAGATWIEGWVETLGSRFAGDYPAHRPITPLEPGETTTLATSGIGHPRRGMLWTRRVSGTCFLAGRTELEIGDAEPAPVTRELWVQADDADASVHSVATREMIETGHAGGALAAFHRMYLRTVAFDVIASASEERDRLRRRVDREAALLDRTFDTLAGVMRPSDATESDTSDAAVSPLLAACRIVGREFGLEIKSPQDHQPARDPVLAIAQASKVRTRTVVLREGWWRRNSGPLLAFREEDRSPVALVQPGPGRYEMRDPVSGDSTRVTPEVAASLEPSARMFLPSFGDHKLTPLALWKLGRRGTTRDIGLIILTSAAAGLLALAAPLISQVLVDEIIPQANRGQLPMIVGLLGVFALVATVFELVRGLVLLRVEARMEMNMEAALMDRLLRLPANFFRRHQSGDLVDRVMGISEIRDLLTGTELAGVLSGIFSVVSLGLILYYDPRLAVLGVVLGLVVIAVILASSLISLRYDRMLAEREGKISGLLLQLISGIGKLRVAAAERRAFDVWSKKFAEQTNLAYRAGAIENNFTVFDAAYPVMTSILFFVVIYLASVSPDGSGTVNAISPGAFFAAITAFGQFLGGLLGLGETVISVLEVVPTYERLKPILDAPLEVKADSADPGKLDGTIEVAHLTFRYTEDGPLILNDVSFSVRPGEMVALVGPSGSGKSTMLRLLLGLERPESGAVHYGGLDLATLDIEAVRRQIGVVLQGGQLMPGDLYSNIVGHWKLSLDKAWAAAEMVGLDDDINEMPMGMHTQVGEGASTFSGGQRQRLMIARAIVHEPPILFLDEATSALDNRTQSVVSESLERMDITRVVIAHRLSTIRHADRIYVMDAGHIVESGDYDSLMEQGGHFAELARRQLL